MGSSRWGEEELAFEKRSVLRCTPSSVQYVNTNKQLIDRAPKADNENVNFNSKTCRVNWVVSSLWSVSRLTTRLECGSCKAVIKGTSGRSKGALLT